MPTNNEIKSALFTLLSDADLGYPIAWPGVDFTPPASGYWLEVSFFPNRGYDDGISASSTVTPEGIFQVNAVTRPGGGVMGVGLVAAQVQAAFAKGTQVKDRVHVSRHPYQTEADKMDDRMMIAVTIEYSG